MSDQGGGSGDPELPPEVEAMLVEGRRMGFEMALVHTHDYDVAEDLAQIAQESLWEMWKSGVLDLSKPLAPLVHTIVGRRCANILRAEADHALPLIKEGFALADSAKVQLDSALHAEAAELEEALRETLQAMPRVQREIWEAAKLDGLSRDRVAAARGKTAAAVSAYLYTANIAMKATVTRFKEDGR